MQKIFFNLENIINWLLYAVVFLVPLYFSFFYRDFSVFSLDKTVLFRVIIEVLVVLTLIKIIKEKSKFINVKRTFLLSFLLYVFIFLLVSIISKDLEKAIWGSYWRQQGLITHAHYWLFFFIVMINVNSREKIIRIINALIASNVIVSLYGIIQWLGLDNFPWFKPVAVGGRIFSTFGQPVFLANFILLSIFPTLYQAIFARKEKSKILYFVAFILQLCCLFLSLTRSAWIGFFVGVLILIFVYFFIKKRIKLFLLYFSIIIASLALVFLALNSISDSYFYKGNIGNNLVARVRGIFDVKSGSTALRFQYWQAGLKAISAKPIFGYGSDNQRNILIQYYQPKWAINETINSSPDRIHSEPLEILFNGGLLLFVFYYLFLFYVFKESILLFKAKKDFFILFIIVGVVSYQVSLLFSFSITTTSMLLWLFLAIMVIESRKINSNKFLLNKKIVKIIIAPVLLIILWLIVGNINSVRADYYFRQARLSFSQNNFLKMYDNYNQVLTLNPRQSYYKWFFLNDSLSTMPQIDSKEYRDNVMLLAKNLYYNNKITGLYENILIKAKLLTMLGIYNKNDISTSEVDQVFYNLLSINSFVPDHYKNWGEFYLKIMEYDKAKIMYEKALLVLPETINENPLNEHVQEIKNYQSNIYNTLAFIALKQEKYEDALSLYFKIIKRKPLLPEGYAKIAHVYSQQGDIAKAIYYYQQALKLDRGNESIALRLSELFLQIKKKEK